MDLNEVGSGVAAWISFVKQAGVIDSGVEQALKLCHPFHSKMYGPAVRV